MCMIQTICCRSLKCFHCINRHSWPAVCDLIAWHVCCILLHCQSPTFANKFFFCPQMPNRMLMNNLPKYPVFCFRSKTRAGESDTVVSFRAPQRLWWRHRAVETVKMSAESYLCALGFGGASLRHPCIVLEWELQSALALRWRWTVSYSSNVITADH